MHRTWLWHAGIVLTWGSAPLLVRAQVNPASAEKVPAIQVPAKASVEELFVDFLHYARLGRFTAADAFAKALLSHPELDPVAVLKAANKDRKSVDTLLIIIKNSTIGDSAQKVLDLIEKGENLRWQDQERIQANIDLLGGDPQQEFIATGRLAASSFGFPRTGSSRCHGGSITPASTNNPG